MVNWKIPLANLNGPTPVKTPDGKMLRTLEDAAKYAEKLGAAKIDNDPLWREAVKQLIWAAESEQPLPFTTNAVREAIYGKVPAKPLPPRPSKAEVWREKRKKGPTRLSAGPVSGRLQAGACRSAEADLIGAAVKPLYSLVDPGFQLVAKLLDRAFQPADDPFEALLPHEGVSIPGLHFVDLRSKS